MFPLPPENAKRTRQLMGQLVHRVARQSPASRAGIRVGDCILSVNDSPTDYDGAVRVALSRHRNGGQVDIVFLRHQRLKTVSVALDAAN